MKTTIRPTLRRCALAVALTGPALTLAPAAQAHEAGHFIVRAGIAGTYLSDDLSRSASFGPWYIKGSLKKSAFSLGLNLGYMVTDHIGVDFFVSRFKHKYTVERNLPGPWSPPPYQKYTGATLTQTPMMLSAVYFPRDKEHDFQPYVGAGVHYTSMTGGFSSRFKADLIPVVGVATVNSWENSLKRGGGVWGLGALLGADYQINKNWLVNAQVRYLGFTKSEGQTIWMLGAGYRF